MQNSIYLRSSKHKNYCVLPFSGIQIDTDGSLKPCCKFDPYLDKEYPKYFLSDYKSWWNEGSKKLRQGFIDKQISPACSVCFNGIDAELGSNTKDFANSLLIKEDPYYQPTGNAEFIDIRFGNICNLKCIMCHPWASSQLANEYKIHQQKFNNIQIVNTLPENYAWWKNPEELQQVLDIVKTAKYLNFSGGEPLGIPELETVLSAVPNDCLVTMTTNITLLTDKHIEIFNNFHEIRLQISLDGVGAHHEYVRFGSDWNTINNNILKLKRSFKHHFDFSYLLQATSVYSFPAFYEYIKSIDKIAMVVAISSRTLNGALTINSIPPEDVDKFREWHDNNKNDYSSIIDQWLDSYTFDPVAHDQFKKYVNTLDEIRGCDFRATFNTNWG